MPAANPRIPGLRPDLPVTAAAARTLEARLTPLAEWVAAAGRGRSPSANAVHNLRVGCRRAGAALMVYRELLPGNACDWWLRRLRKLRRAAGPIRTLDVLIHRLTEHHPAAPLLDHWKHKRRRLLDPFRTRLERLPTAERLTERRQDLVGAIGWGGAGDEPTIAAWAAEPLSRVVEEFLAAEPSERDHLASLHEFRVTGKRLRYTLELLGPALGAKAIAVVPIVSELQSRLGAIQDRCDVCRQLGVALDHAHRLTDLRVIVTVLQSEAAALTEDLRGFWRFWKAARPRLRPLQVRRSPR